ncbi:hypothetical protein [Desulfovibrio piger]|uniref:hypothetical protein n=1 Tax=Desulfovibrio piger TaxID=901 RepID=UPI002431AA29|nr:hypothetical protein [Desulfovibrio piger]MCI7508051.1 hypothetical protein [Desulfovibrio piger]
MNSLPTPLLVVLSSVLWGLLLACCGYIWNKVDKRLDGLERGLRKAWEALIRLETAIAQLREDMVRDVDCAERRSKMRLDMAHQTSRLESLRAQLESLNNLRCCK